MGARWTFLDIETAWLASTRIAVGPVRCCGEGGEGGGSDKRRREATEMPARHRPRGSGLGDEIFGTNDVT